MLTRGTSSLRLMLIDRLLPAMIVLLLFGALAANWLALRAATKAYDRGLLDTAFAISEQLRIVDGKVQLPLTPQARVVLLTDKFDRIFYAARGVGGELLDGDPGLPMPEGESVNRLHGEGRAYYDGMLDEEPIRLAVLQKELGGGRPSPFWRPKRWSSATKWYVTSCLACFSRNCCSHWSAPV